MWSGGPIRNNKNYYYLDDGVYGDFSGIVFDHCKYEFKTLKKTPKFISILSGTDLRLVRHDCPGALSAGIGGRRCGVRSEHRSIQLREALTFNGIPPAKVIVV